MLNLCIFTNDNTFLQKKVMVIVIFGSLYCVYNLYCNVNNTDLVCFNLEQSVILVPVLFLEYLF